MAAPAGNKYALGNSGGRPARFDTPEALAEAVDAYFLYIQGEYHTEKRKWKNEDTGKTETIDQIVWDRHPEPATVTGLCLFLGFASRSSLDDYEARQEFSDFIKRARMRVEHAYEMKLHGDKNTGAIFALKNMGWKDKTEVESKNVNLNSEPLTPHRIREISKALEADV
jgi:hypothetical protein